MEKQWFDFNKAIFLLFIIAVIIIIKAALTSQTSSLEQEANIVLTKLTDGHQETSLLNSNEIDVEKLRKLDKMDYNEIKDRLGVKNDFCIYFEDTTGNIVKIDNTNTGIGSGKIYINGQPCR